MKNFHVFRESGNSDNGPVKKVSPFPFCWWGKRGSGRCNGSMTCVPSVPGCRELEGASLLDKQWKTAGFMSNLPSLRENHQWAEVGEQPAGPKEGEKQVSAEREESQGLMYLRWKSIEQVWTVDNYEMMMQPWEGQCEASESHRKLGTHNFL